MSKVPSIEDDFPWRMVIIDICLTVACWIFMTELDFPTLKKFVIALMICLAVNFSKRDWNEK